MKLKNETETDISLSYGTGYVTRIGAGDVKKEPYSFHCITIVSDGIAHEFQADWAPSEFVDKHMFSSTVDAVFTKDRKLVLVQRGNQDAALEIDQGCN